MTNRPGWFFMGMKTHTAFAAALLAASFFLIPHASAVEQGCNAKAFAALIDETAQTLRNLNRDSERRFQERLQAIGRAQAWTEAQMAAKANEAMDDSRLGTFNTELEQLVSQLDTLSATPSTDVSCDRLSDLKSVRDRLVTVMNQKSGFILAQLEAEGAKAPHDTKENTQAAALKSEPVSPPPVPSVAARQAQGVAPEQTPLAWRPHTSWSTDVSGNQPPSESAAANRSQAPEAPQVLAPLPLRPTAPAQSGTQSGEKLAALTPPVDNTLPPPSSSVGYTVQEIRDAGHGVFGTLTSELAAVINYSFKKFGQPNAYIIGDEGGGAFLAGLRYGEGQLYSRVNGIDVQPTRIYWQGPSVGVDIGATGSRSLFLVYNLDDIQGLYKRFPGIDGSAYVAGGFGLTVFKSGRTIIVPIRTGLGLRLGASLAYLKFTERASWNPF